MNRSSQLLFLALPCAAFAPRAKNRPFECGFYASDSSHVYRYYQNILQYIETMPGERVVSIGAQNGNMEVQLAFFRPGIAWTVQDINAGCLNETEFGKVKSYYEELFHRKINGTFSLVLGTEDSTRLPTAAYDRVLLLNTYHELNEPALMLRDIHRVLRPGGRLVLMERIATKPEQKRKDCNHLMPVESTLLSDLEQAGFRLAHKAAASGKHAPTFYVLERD